MLRIDRVCALASPRVVYQVFSCLISDRVYPVANPFVPTDRFFVPSSCRVWLTIFLLFFRFDAGLFLAADLLLPYLLLFFSWYCIYRFSCGRIVLGVEVFVAFDRCFGLCSCRVARDLFCLFFTTSMQAGFLL